MLIAIPVIEETVENAVRKRKEAERTADVVELRVDYIKGFNENELEKLLEGRKKPVIITNRKKEERGKFEGSEEDRIKVLKKAIELGAEYVDIENSTDDELIRVLTGNKGETRIIISSHDFEKTPSPEEMEKKLEEIRDKKGDIAKIITYANSPDDCLVIYRLLQKNRDKKIISFCMGEKGSLSRMNCLAFGSYMTFGSLEKGKESAPGQLTADTIKEQDIWHVNEKTEIYGVTGQHIGYSLSTFMQTAAFKEAGMNAVYLAFDIENVREGIKTLVELGIKGLNVTIPHKVAASGVVDNLETAASEIGAINTIRIRNGIREGHNTDCEGAMRALKEKTEIKGKKVLILGAGGAARAVAFGIKREGGKLIILNRTVEKAKKLAEELDCDYGALDSIKEKKGDILINTTSTGMSPYSDRTLVPKEDLRNFKVVFDIVYKPRRTRLLKEAEEQGCETIEGMEMFVCQGARSFEIWTGKQAPVSVMRKVVLNKLGD